MLRQPGPWMVPSQASSPVEAVLMRVSSAVEQLTAPEDYTYEKTVGFLRAKDACRYAVAQVADFVREQGEVLASAADRAANEGAGGLDGSGSGGGEQAGDGRGDVELVELSPAFAQSLLRGLGVGGLAGDEDVVNRARHIVNVVGLGVLDTVTQVVKDSTQVGAKPLGERVIGVEKLGDTGKKLDELGVDLVVRLRRDDLDSVRQGVERVHSGLRADLLPGVMLRPVLADAEGGVDPGDVVAPVDADAATLSVEGVNDSADAAQPPCGLKHLDAVTFAQPVGCRLVVEVPAGGEIGASVSFSVLGEQVVEQCCGVHASKRSDGCGHCLGCGARAGDAQEHARQAAEEVA